MIGPWFAAFRDRITGEQRREVKVAAAFVAARIAELPDVRQQHRDVAECYKEMRAIVDSA